MVRSCALRRGREWARCAPARAAGGGCRPGGRGRRPRAHVHRHVRGGDAGRRDYRSSSTCRRATTTSTAARSARLSASARACLLPVHLYGQMADMRALRDLGERHGVPILEDACQAHGAERDGLRAGSAGDMAAFSFYPSKNLGAMGDAGAFVTDDEQLAARVRMLREHGQTATYRSRGPGLHRPARHRSGAGALCKLRHVAGWNAQRAAAAAASTRRRSPASAICDCRRFRREQPVWHLYVARTRGSSSSCRVPARARDRDRKALSRASAPLARLRRGSGFAEGAFPVAEAVAREGLSLPLFPGISETQLARVCEAIRTFFAHG